MKSYDIDLDVSSLLANAPSEDAVFYFHGSPNGESDFCYAKGDLEYMADTLVNLMCSDDRVADMILGAAGEFLSDDE